MHEEVRDALKKTIKQALTALQPFTPQESETYLVWRRREDGAWTGAYENRPSLLSVLDKVDWNSLAGEVREVFRRYHPEYRGFIGTAVSGMMQLDVWFLNIFRWIIGELWQKHSTWSISNDAIHALIQEFATFIDNPTIPVTYLVPLVNFRMEGKTEPIPLPNGVTIRRLNEEEVSEIYGGRVEFLATMPRPNLLHEFAFVGEFEEPKIVGESLESLTAGSLAYSEVLKALNRTILALRTFKKGQIGYNTILLLPRTFCPIPLGGKVYRSEYVPHGGYGLSAEEMQPFREHASYIFAELHPSLEMACSRLSDAEIRFQSSDRLVDAVIGLETVLLANYGKEEYRGEMRYRFSLNYSTLFDSPEDRYQAFSTAKLMYDLRSKIVHGSQVKADKVKVANKEVNLSVESEKACEMLRLTVRRFLPNASNPPYTRANYWEKAYFGLIEEK